MKEILTQQLCQALRGCTTAEETGAAYANVLNSYVASHVQVIGVYSGVIPPGVPEAGGGNFKVIGSIQPLIFGNSDFVTWVQKIETALKTQIHVVPPCLTPPLVITSATVPCFSLAKLVLTQQMIASAYQQLIVNGELKGEASQVQYKCQEVIAGAIILALQTGFTVTPYASTQVGTGMTTLTGTLIL